MNKRFEGSITDIKPLLVGQAQDEEAQTGVTVILCGKNGAAMGVDVRGASPGTRETDLCLPENSAQCAHAVMLSGGSAFGLNAAAGIMDVLEKEGIGADVGVTRVPIVPAAVIFDLAAGRSDVRPDADMAREAVRNAGKEVLQGAYGAGCGATVGKLVYGSIPARGGVGTASMRLADGCTVAAIVVVNAGGDVFHPHTGERLACGHMSNGEAVSVEQNLFGEIPDLLRFMGLNTTIGVVATDAPLSKAECKRIATCGHDGLARTIRPVHTTMDGDTLFALATGTRAGQYSFVALCAAAAEVTARAVANAVYRE